MEHNKLQRQLLEISEREQQRLGRDLHDGLGQHLHGLSYLADLLEKNLQEEASAHAVEAGRLKRYILESLDLTRSLAHGLQPVESVPQGLMAGLLELSRRTTGLYRVNCRFDCPIPVLIQKHDVAIHLYRIAQEAVNNAIKHGKPKQVCIKLHVARAQLVLSICDNGCGIREIIKDGYGMGLHIMRYRADVLNGSLLIKGEAGCGTKVLCTVGRRLLLSDKRRNK